MQSNNNGGGVGKKKKRRNLTIAPGTKKVREKVNHETEAGAGAGELNTRRPLVLKRGKKED